MLLRLSVVEIGEMVCSGVTREDVVHIICSRTVLIWKLRVTGRLPERELKPKTSSKYEEITA